MGIEHFLQFLLDITTLDCPHLQTVASALTSIVEACENAERIAKQRNSDKEKAVSLLRKLRDEVLTLRI